MYLLAVSAATVHGRPHLMEETGILASKLVGWVISYTRSNDTDK